MQSRAHWYKRLTFDSIDASIVASAHLKLWVMYFVQRFECDKSLWPSSLPDPQHHLCNVGPEGPHGLWQSWMIEVHALHDIIRRILYNFMRSAPACDTSCCRALGRLYSLFKMHFQDCIRSTCNVEKVWCSQEEPLYYLDGKWNVNDGYDCLAWYSLRRRYTAKTVKDMPTASLTFIFST